MNSEVIKVNSPASARSDKAFQHGVARRLVEGIMFSRDGETTFFDAGSFPWASSVEAEWTRGSQGIGSGYGAPGGHSEFPGYF